MFHQLKDYLHFTKSERAGILSLIVLIVLLIAGKYSLIYFSPDIKHDPEIISEINQKIVLAQKQDSIVKQKLKNEEKLKSSTYKENIEIPQVKFNPNELELDDWKNYGLSEKQAQVILNYKEAAGGFKSKAQVQKMFVISEELYAKMEGLIDLPDTNIREKKTFVKFDNSSNYESKKWEPRVYKKIDINTADTAEFKSLYGIGKVLAERIVRHREKLGGFISKDQLKEIYGLRPETLINLDTLLLFTPKKVKKLNVNVLMADELKQHPYIYWKQANAIEKYRLQHGKYRKLEDIKKSILITDSIYQKILPYIEL